MSRISHTNLRLIAYSSILAFGCGDDSSSSSSQETESASTGGSSSTGTSGESTGPTGSGSGPGTWEPTSSSSSSSTSSETTSSETTTGGIAAYQEALNFVIEKIDLSHRHTLEGRSAALEKAITAAQEEIYEVETDFEFELLVGRMLVALGDGHSTVGPTISAMASLESIDLPMLWLDEGPVVVRATDLLEAGDRVVSIGGRGVETIMEDLSEHVSRDNDGYLRHAGPQLVPREDWIEPMGMAKGDIVEVEVDRDGETLTLDLPLQAGLQVGPAPDREFVGYTIEPENDLGVLYLDDCVYDMTYAETLDAFMVEVREQEIGKVAIDLRYNGGGDVTVAYAFLAHLAPEYASFSISARKSDALFEQALVYSNEDFLALLGAFEVDLEGPTFEVPGAALSVGFSGVVPPVEPENMFGGEVYLLVSPTTYSSAQLFVGQIVDNELGLTVGDQTGANRNTTGDMLWFDVPETEVRFSLGGSWMSRPAADAEQAPTLADIPVSITRDDILSDVDPQLDAIREL